jgi:hypothetical protein
MAAKPAVPLTLTASIRASLAAKTAGTYPLAGRFGYLSDDTKAILIGTGVNTSPLEYPEKSAIAAMISTALAGLATGMTPKGNYNAEANTPTLPAAATGNAGWFYKVTTARTTGTAIPNTGLIDVKAGDLVWSDGTSWDKIDNTEITYSAATSSVMGLMSAADKAKLDGVAASATTYTHPSTHPASIIAQDASSRFVTDTEKATWNAKESAFDEFVAAAIV